MLIYFREILETPEFALMNTEPAILYKKDKNKFNENARNWTMKHAMLTIEESKTRIEESMKINVKC